MSSRNPFRREEGTAPPSPPLPPLPPSPSQKPPALSPSSPTAGPSEMPSNATPSRSSAPPAMGDIDDDDLPPPYTPAANVGEETIGLGPQRPFQPPPSLRPPPNQPLHSNWPQPYHPSAAGPSSGFYAQPSLAPWQSQYQYRQRQKGSGGLIGALIDTVRDIADEISGANDYERMMAARNANAYAAPYPETRPMYAPPPGPPQPPAPRSASVPPRSPPPIVPDDGSPTRTPVPGHPLLLDDNLLVYPRDHLCVKCKNTGYKNYDPSHPCRKCWDKYGRPYTGALTYTPWAPSGNDPRMQRPLPKFLPPHLAGSSQGLFPPPPRHPHHSRSISQPRHAQPSTSGSGPSYFVVNPLSPGGPLPVPDAIAVDPGDPRLGGRLCMRCDGAGVRSVMLFDLMMCDNCGGTGRVWRD